MIKNNELTCPKCGGALKYYDSVQRIVRTKGGNIRWIKVDRLSCIDCGSTHRKLPDYLLPYKHYEAEIIKGFLAGELTSSDLDYEDYPCETTIKQWEKERDKHLL